MLFHCALHSGHGNQGSWLLDAAHTTELHRGWMESARNFEHGTPYSHAKRQCRPIHEHWSKSLSWNLAVRLCILTTLFAFCLMASSQVQTPHLQVFRFIQCTIGLFLQLKSQQDMHSILAGSLPLNGLPAFCCISMFITEAHVSKYRLCLGHHFLLIAKCFQLWLGDWSTLLYSFYSSILIFHENSPSLVIECSINHSHCLLLTVPRKSTSNLKTHAECSWFITSWLLYPLSSRIHIL